MTKRLSLLLVLVIGIGAGALMATAIPSLLGAAPTDGGGVVMPAPSLASTDAVARVERDPAAGARLATEAYANTAVSALPSYREVTIPAGTALRLRLENGVASDTSSAEDQVRAHLIAPVVVDGRTVVPINSRASGHVTAVRRSGKVKGRGYVAMRFTELSPLRGDDSYRITTRVWGREAPGTKKKDAVKIGVPAGVGALVGGIVGGKKGAGVGAAVGGGAGTGVVLATRGEEVRIGRGATLVVRLAAPVTVRVPSRG